MARTTKKVSKNQILGSGDIVKKIKIFLTVGTRIEAFDRLVELGDQLARTGKYKIIAQIGPSKPPRYIKNWVRFTPLEEFRRYVTMTATFSNGKVDTLDIDKIILPVGISFYTFQSLSYVIDISKGKLKPVDNIIDYGFFVKMKNPYNSLKKLIMIGGAHTYGVFGAIKAFSYFSNDKKEISYQNCVSIIDALGNDPEFAILFKVESVGCTVLTPKVDLSNIEPINL